MSPRRPPTAALRQSRPVEAVPVPVPRSPRGTGTDHRQAKASTLGAAWLALGGFLGWVLAHAEWPTTFTHWCGYLALAGAVAVIVWALREADRERMAS